MEGRENERNMDEATNFHIETASDAKLLHKKPCHTLLTVIFEPAIPMYLSCNSRAVDAGFLYFTYTHPRLSQKLTSSTVMCIEINII